MKYFWLAFSLFISIQGFAIDPDTLDVYSSEMDKKIPAVVVVPDEYNKLDMYYPVLYLLHGHSGDHLSWLSIEPDLQDYVNTYQMIVVMPDGGYDSWYIDSPIDDEVRYESFITETLVPTIDSLYNTRENRAYRGIAGLSMGGHGAFYLAIKHQDLFGAASALSGGVDIRPFPDNWGLKDILGEQDQNKENWENHTVMNLTDDLEDGALQLFIDIGVEDIFIDVNRNLHKKLLDQEISHDYIERPGGHTSDYWQKTLPYNMLFFSEYFYAED